MATVVTEDVWLDRGNPLEWILLDTDGNPIADLSAVTRVVICVGDTEVDSDIEGSSVIWWTDSVTNKPLGDNLLYTGDVLKAKLGLVSNLTEGEYDCVLVIYTAEYPNGFVVSNDIRITVQSTCIAGVGG